VPAKIEKYIMVLLGKKLELFPSMGGYSSYFSLYTMNNCSF
jgi:hypothetical protein